MKVKIVFGSDIRRWHVPQENQFEELVHFIQETFNFPDAGDFFLQFEDDEGDRMTVTSSSELSDAFIVAEQEGRRSLKIYLVPVSIREAHSEVISHFGSSRSIASSLDRFEVLSNAPSHAGSSFSSSIEVPELNETDDADVDVEFVEDSKEEAAVEESGPRPWKEELRDFLANEMVASKLDEYVRAIMGALRAQDEPDLRAALSEGSCAEFEMIESQPLMVHYVLPQIELISYQAQCLLPVLLAFDDDHVAKIIPQLVETGEQLFAGSDAELDVTPIFGLLFPDWMAHMNSNNPDGAVVDLSHIFGCGNAFDAAVAMMGEMECKEEETVHHGIICDMCNADPIVGARFKCTVCPNFDMCGTCEATNTHNRDHPLLKLKRPRRGLKRGEMHGLREMFHRGRCGWKQCWREQGDEGTKAPFADDLSTKVGDSNLTREQVRQLCCQEKLAAKQTRIQSKIDALQEEIDKPDVQHPEGVLSCVCGSGLERVYQSKAYAHGARIHCDSCGHLCRDDDEIYHCPNEFSATHPNGFDMCDGCARHQIRIARELAEEVEQRAVTDVNVRVPSVHEEESEFAFADGLDQLLQMGFESEDRVRKLLVANEGNIEQVVHQLFDGM